MSAETTIEESLIIFTRYPEPGKTKTRLISSLGAEGAANLQRQMTEHTLSNARKLQSNRAVAIEVLFAGGNLTLMRDWLGTDLIYRPQASGDLGWRMARSLATSFGDNATRAVIIGTDCPSLSVEIMATAFDRLLAADLVLGPAVDGGYYLIGLRRLVPELFTNISWGTAEVFRQTVKLAQQLNLAVACLPQLADVDRPEDLPLWEQRL